MGYHESTVCRCSATERGSVSGSTVTAAYTSVQPIPWVREQPLQVADPRSKDPWLLVFICGSPIPLHFSVCTSTEYTAGRSCTTVFHELPPSREQYTWPPVVPK